MSGFFKYISQPAACEALQFTQVNAERFRGLEGIRMIELPEEVILEMKTTQGNLAIAREGDYIVKEPDGNGYYPVKQSIFESRWVRA